MQTLVLAVFVLLPPSFVLASPYRLLTEEEFHRRMFTDPAKLHPKFLSEVQAREDLEALEAAVRDIWRQRWAGGRAAPVDVGWIRARAAALPRGKVPFDAFLDLAASCVQSLRDAHAYVMTAGQPLGRVADKSNPVLWRTLSPGIGLLRIDRLPSPDEPFGESFPGLIDRAFAELGGTQGLVLDLRNNAGGDPNQADRLFDHLVSSQVFLYYEVVRRSPAMEHYLGAERLADWEWEEGSEYSKPRTVAYEPEPAPRYKGKILVLADARTVSAGEYILSELVDNGLARFAGERTPGRSGSIVAAALPHSNLMVALPIQHVLRRNKLPLQHRGVTPQYPLDPQGPDLLKKAEAILRTWIAENK